MQITQDAVVSIDYTLKGDDGSIFDTSEGRTPLAYLHGRGQLLPGVEAALMGKATGDSVQVTLPAADGYGERQEALVANVPKTEFPADDVQVGMQFKVGPSEAEARVVTVTEVNDDSVTLDANHPLAGETLHFAIEIVAVREATEEELSHGHAHGEGGVHH